jgi:pimeloyl-ACP methyl ester carboxylesterase
MQRLFRPTACLIPIGSPSFMSAIKTTAVLLSAAVGGGMCLFAAAYAQQQEARTDPRTNIRRVLPPPGIEAPRRDLEMLREALDSFSMRKHTVVAKTAGSDQVTPREDDLADALIFEKAVRYAIDLGEFYQPRDFGRAAELLKVGRERLDELAHGRASWAQARGPVVRGYRSRIDDSVQPYGLLIPEKLNLDQPVPLYVWLHGRNDKGTDLHFIAERMRSRGEFAPDDAIVLHVFGRYCNAFKFAGEIDVFEAIDSVKNRYRVDPRRTVLMGFSMGGAGVWHLGAHYPDRFVAMTPGAGFVDTRRYQRIPDSRLPPWYEQKLWGLYDVPDYTRNLFNLPVVSYSGEVDNQKASADIMEEEFVRHGKKLERVIGAKMGHRYDAPSKEIILLRLAEERDRPRDLLPAEVTLQTRTLRYNKVHWVVALALGEHWSDARIDARRTRLPDATWRVDIATKNIAAFRCQPGSGSAASARDIGEQFVIDGQQAQLPPPGGLWRHVDGRWVAAAGLEQASGSLVKRHGLQGPIDDAFLEPFLFVRPTGKSPSAAVGQWVEVDLPHQIQRWKELFRGDVRVKDDKDVTREDQERYHLILWGDPSSNQILAQAAVKLPIQWTTDTIQAGRSPGSSYSAQTCVVAMIYPNPLNPERYIVLNSGPTFREDHDRSNSQQTPKLPDWAVLDVTAPPTGRAAGKVLDAGFFDENWQLTRREAGAAKAAADSADR